jgi:hypothetical protein
MGQTYRSASDQLRGVAAASDHEGSLARAQPRRQLRRLRCRSPRSLRDEGCLLVVEGVPCCARAPWSAAAQLPPFDPAPPRRSWFYSCARTSGGAAASDHVRSLGWKHQASRLRPITTDAGVPMRGGVAQTSFFDVCEQRAMAGEGCLCPTAKRCTVSSRGR